MCLSMSLGSYLPRRSKVAMVLCLGRLGAVEIANTWALCLGVVESAKALVLCFSFDRLITGKLRQSCVTGNFRTTQIIPHAEHTCGISCALGH